MKPLIGICANYDGSENSYGLKEAYVRSLQTAGGVVVILPPGEDEGLMDEYIACCHGFIFPGGGDIDPCYWGELPQPELGEINPLRDSFEIGLARKLLVSEIPLLGICRGCQLLNIAAGGSLIQDLQSPMSHQQKAPREYPFHDIFIKNDSRLAAILHSTQIKVNSFHHQAVRSPGTGMQISARASDGIVEAIEGEGPSFVLGVQWHPECLLDENSGQLFKALVEAAYISKNNRQIILGR